MTNPNRRPRIWQTSTFRLALIFSLIFGVGSSVLLFALDITMSRIASDEMEDSLRSQMAIMRADANIEGGDALVNVLREHRDSGDPSPYSYLVITPDGARFNDGLPDDIATDDGIRRISVPSTDSRPGKGNETMDVMVLIERALDGTIMAVARPTLPLDHLSDGLHLVALAGGLGLTLLALLAGQVIGALLLTRVDKVSRAAERIASEDITQRLPAIGFGREFDVLVANLNRMLDRLGLTMKALRQVSTDLAHDLRTPLSRLRNTLEEGVSDPDDKRAIWAARGIAEIDETLEILNALLRIAQVEGLDRTSAFAPLDISALAAIIADAYRPEAEERGQTIVVDAEPNVAAIGDAALLKQLLVNLIDNSLQHTPAGTTISVSVISRDGYAVVAVADNGPGIPPGEAENIVKRFYRLDRSRSTPGAGLGLTLAKAIAELHGTPLTISDNRPGLRISLSLER